MSDVYLSNGTNIGRLIAVVVIGTTPNAVLERLDTHTVIVAPLGAGISVVEICVLCHFRPKLTDPATQQIISDLCSVDQPH